MVYSPTAPEVDFIIRQALQEDIGPGDYTTLAILPQDRPGAARCLIKDTGVLAGVAFAKQVFATVNPSVQFEQLLQDGARVQPGDIAFTVRGSQHTLLTCERLVLNVMQRMSGIATQTRAVVDLLAGTNCRVLDTRKTTPLLRYLEKWAVTLGGGVNHRHGLYDMILIKDNHIDYAGGIVQAIAAAKKYLETNGLALPIVVETRTLDEVELAVATPGLTRILLDNMAPDMLHQAIALIAGRYPTEASGGITLQNVRAIAETGVNFVSMGSLTHSVPSLDISLKAIT
jgi:nicotinate-nucleotide pyrophosphorylase (carboxylating)